MPTPRVGIREALLRLQRGDIVPLQELLLVVLIPLELRQTRPAPPPTHGSGRLSAKRAGLALNLTMATFHVS